VILIRHGQTEFNRVFAASRQDPGIRDPQLTELGRRQAEALAGALLPLNLSRLVSSPYARALETAGIIAAQLNLPIVVEPLVAERFSFVCDIGSPLGELRARWPDLTFDHLPDQWWPAAEETEEMIFRRSRTFGRQIAGEFSSQVGVVTHWGFIRALTGLRVPNGAVLRIDPTQPENEAELLFVPGEE
jgi:broad specificity phosphatase PhoE